MQNAKIPYQSIIENTEIYGIFMLDENGIVKTWNKGAQRIIGYQASEIIGRNFNIFFTKEDQQQLVPEQVRELIKIKEVVTKEGWRVKKNGDLFLGDISATAQFDDNKILVGIFIIVRDITEKQMQVEFEHKNMDALINNTSDLMWSVDRDYKLITANKAFDKLVIEMPIPSISLLNAEHGGMIFNI